MSEVKVYHEDHPEELLQQSREPGEIAAILDKAGVRFERWVTEDTIQPGDAELAVIGAYVTNVDKLMVQEGYQSVDVISLNSDHPEKEALRQKFLSEHTHSEDEVRFFVSGEGLFSLHIEDKVYEVLCTEGDLISVPANTPHWFDMGPNPSLVAIRLFTNKEGWVARYTDNDIAGRFSRLEN